MQTTLFERIDAMSVDDLKGTLTEIIAKWDITPSQSETVVWHFQAVDLLRKLAAGEGEASAKLFLRELARAKQILFAETIGVKK